MTTTIRAAVLALAFTLAAAASLQALGEGRVIATLVDEAGTPVEGAKLVLTMAGSGYKQEKTSDKKGQITILVLDATKQYLVRVDKEGFAPFEGPLDPKPEETLKVTFTLAKAAQAAAAAAAPPPEVTGKDKAVVAYNEGVGVLRGGDLAGAAAKFELAATEDPALAEAQAVLSEIYLELKRPADALAAADRYLALKPAEPRGLRARYDAILATGDKAKAKEALDAMVAADPGPETALRLFNMGAEVTREGSADAYDKAAVYFEQVIKMAPDDPKYAIAHYVTGLAYAKDETKKAQARERLEKFLQLAPDHAEAKAAREMLEYLK